MSQAGWMPVDESQATSQWTPVPEEKSNIPKPAPKQDYVNSILGKATGIGPSTWDIPGLQKFEQGFRSVGQPAGGLGEQGSLAGNIGQLAGILTKNPATQALFGTVAPQVLPSGSTTIPVSELQSINEAIGATKTSVRIPKSATTIAEAITNPARGLLKEGLTAKSLSKMAPLEQQAAVKPLWDAAGQAIDKAAIDATAKNLTLNPSKSALEVANSIQNPILQDKAVKQLSSLMEEVGIRDASKATPLETLQLRRALQSGARFGPNGDLSSLGGIRARLYGAVSKDLSDSIQGFSELDTHYSDLNSAMKAINNSAAKSAVKSPSSLISNLAPVAAREGAKALGAGAAGGTLYGIYRMLKK